MMMRPTQSSMARNNARQGSVLSKENVNPNIRTKMINGKKSEEQPSREEVVKGQKQQEKVVKSTMKVVPPTVRSGQVKSGMMRLSTTQVQQPQDVKRAKPAPVASWDIRSRLQAMETMTRTLREQVDQLSGQLGDRDSQLEVVSKIKSTLQEDVTNRHEEIRDVKSRNEELLKLLDEEERRHEEQRAMLESKLALAQSRLESSELNLRTVRGEVARLQQTNQNQSENLEKLKNGLDETCEKLLKSENEVNLRGEKINKLEMEMERNRQQIEELEVQSREDEQLRRNLHNVIQELKGNIRVFCRVRALPTSSSNMNEDESVRLVYGKNDPTTLDIIQKQARDVTGCKSAPDKRHAFKFDRVFSNEASQEMVFSEISQLVQSALDGYHTCIFAYGQTGSGKTYTMEGPERLESEYPEKEGMISRSVTQIFEASERLREKGWYYTMQAGFLEIYNEVIRDLLDPKSAEEKKCEIKHDMETGLTTVSNQLIVQVKSRYQVYELLRIASRNRAVGATQLNSRSSRSHSVFQLRIAGNNPITGEMIEGVLNLVDLAGSERVSASGATGERFVETRNINKSLSCLNDVIAALANKDKHVPFRNSKLTYLLQNSLGGNAKTLMFVNISPAPENISETLNSLRFASRVNSCDIGTARKGGRIDLTTG